MESKALNFKAWIDEHRHLLKPPVGNKKICPERLHGDGRRRPERAQGLPCRGWQEFFQQIEGDMVLKVIEDGQAVDIPIREGEISSCRRIPHSPQRPNSIGLVVERKRQPSEMDGMQWYCEACARCCTKSSPTPNIGTQFKPIFDFYADEPQRTCRNCGTVMRAARQGLTCSRSTSTRTSCPRVPDSEDAGTAGSCGSSTPRPAAPG